MKKKISPPIVSPNEMFDKAEEHGEIMVMDARTGKWFLLRFTPKYED